MTEFTIPDVNLDFDEIIAEAKTKAELVDFGDTEFFAPLKVLLKSLTTEANLNMIGRFGQRSRIVDILINRLRVENYLQRFPQILQETIENPIFIVGLPRTGTTMLHRILASDSRYYAPIYYELRSPAPLPGYAFQGEDTRIAVSEAEVAAMVEANPDLAAIHPLDACGADEEILLLEQSFYSTVPESFANVPSFGRWLNENDNTPGYAYLKKLLQFLQWQKKQKGQSAQRWLLKSPHHLHYMGILLKVFPDAKIIQTHRDPLQTIPSLCSFNQALWVLGSESVDAKSIGEQWGKKFAVGMRHTMLVREKTEEQFLDVSYKDTTTDPEAVIESVYQFIDMPLTAEAKSAMHTWRVENRREDRAVHNYSLEQFGFTAEQLENDFKEYRDKYIKTSISRQVHLLDNNEKVGLNP